MCKALRYALHLFPEAACYLEQGQVESIFVDMVNT